MERKCVTLTQAQKFGSYRDALVRDAGLMWMNIEVLLTLQRGVMGTARMLHALTHSSISRQVREQM